MKLNFTLHILLHALVRILEYIKAHFPERPLSLQSTKGFLKNYAIYLPNHNPTCHTRSFSRLLAFYYCQIILNSLGTYELFLWGWICERASHRICTTHRSNTFDAHKNCFDLFIPLYPSQFQEWGFSCCVFSMFSSKFCLRKVVLPTTS